MGGRIEEAIAALRQAERLATTRASSRRPRHHLQQPGKRRAYPASARSGAGAGRTERGAAGADRAWPWSGDLSGQLGADSRPARSARAGREGSPSALKVRSPIQFHEITGAVYDSLAQIALMRGDIRSPRAITCGRPERRTAATAPARAAGTNGPFVRWKPSSRHAAGPPRKRSGSRSKSRQPQTLLPPRRFRPTLIACEALLAAGRAAEAHAGLGRLAGRIDARAMPGEWGEFLRLRGAVHGAAGRLSEAYHDIAQSASVFELVGDGYQGALSHLALGRLASRAGARSQAEHQFARAAALFESLGAARDLAETQTAASMLPAHRFHRSRRRIARRRRRDRSAPCRRSGVSRAPRARNRRCRPRHAWTPSAPWFSWRRRTAICGWWPGPEPMRNARDRSPHAPSAARTEPGGSSWSRLAATSTVRATSPCSARARCPIRSTAGFG